MNNITTDVSLTNDADDPVGAYLVDPNGNVAGYGQNSINGSQRTSLTAWAVNPIQGTWTLIVDFAEPIAGDEVSQPFTGSIAFNAVNVSAAGMPDSAGTTLPAGQPVTVPVTITNNGEQAEDFFVDPRLASSTTVALAPFSQASGLALPLVVGPPQWFMPTEASAVSVAATASLPIEFDYRPDTGDPDLASSIGTSRAGLIPHQPGTSRTGSGPPRRARSGPTRPARRRAR